MTLRDYYDNLPKRKQADFRLKWMQKTKKSRSNFYLMLRDASESDIRFFSQITGVEANEIHKPIEVQLQMFSTNSKYRKAQ